MPVCGTADIVNHQWRRNTATVEVKLPSNPADQTLYYTIWKDGQDVTSDGRIGTDACGPGMVPDHSLAVTALVTV